MAGDDATTTTPAELRGAGAGQADRQPSAPDRHFGRFVVTLSFGVGAFAMAWLAYIDAPITDEALLMLGLAVLCSLAAAAAGFGVEQCDDQRPGPEAEAAAITQFWRRRSRRCRAAVAFLLAAYALAALSCGLALNLRGYGGENGEQQAIRTTHRV